MNLPSSETIRRAKAGNLRAREELLRAFAGRLRALVRRWGSPMDPEDQLQGLFVKLLQVLPQFRLDGRTQLSTWVFTVAHRTLLEQRRRPQLAVVPLEHAEDLADERCPQQALEQAELRRKEDQAIAEPPDEQRRVLVLAQIHHQPLEAIANVERIPVGTVKSRLHRARARLVSTLAGVLEEGDGGQHVSRRA